jgi:hypothetical protein
LRENFEDEFKRRVKKTKKIWKGSADEALSQLDWSQLYEKYQSPETDKSLWKRDELKASRAMRKFIKNEIDVFRKGVMNAKIPMNMFDQKN